MTRAIYGFISNLREGVWREQVKGSLLSAEGPAGVVQQELQTD